MNISLDVTKKYALAVSGGVDSMVLLHLFVTHKPNVNFFVVTVNHNLREEAQKDCDFVKSQCQKYGIDCVCHQVDCLGYAQENKVSIETAGRILRKQIFENLPCDLVATAHHKDDNAESILMHLLRGSGLTGASGIKDDLRFVHPLLPFTKEEILSFAKEMGIKWVQDQTNFENVFVRNRLRNQVFPLLEESFSNFKDNLIRFSQNASQDDAFLNHLADISTVEVKDGVATIPTKLLCQPLPIAVRVVKKVFALLGIDHDVERTHLLAICQLAEKQGGKKVCLPFDLIAVNDYNYITICKNTQQKQDFPWVAFEKQPKAYPTPFGVVNCQKGWGKLRFDMDKVPSGAVLRLRQDGDVFCPFGGGSKKLKEWLIDKKVSARFRDQLLVVAKDKHVLIVVGMEIAHSIKTDENTKNIFHIDKE